jgi:hypothetical protein
VFLAELGKYLGHFAEEILLRELEASGDAEKLFFKWLGPNTRLKYQTRSFRIDTDRIAN